MKKWLNLSLSILLGALILGGCATNKGVKEKASESKPADSTYKKGGEYDVKWPYYEIRKDGSIAGYLLGTVHMGKPEMYPFPDKIITDLAKSDNFITEVERTKMEKPADQEGKYAAMMAETPITNEMSEETRKKYQAILASYDLTEEGLASLNRYGVYMLLFSMVGATDASFDPEEAKTYGVDSQLTIHHKKNKKQKNIALETSEFQTEKMIEGFSVPKDINQWVDSLLTKEENANSSSNVGSIQEYMDSGSNIADVPKEQNEILNYARNKTWSEELPDYLKKDHQSFIAVGNAHLVGDRGLVKLLEKQGYKLTRITFE